MLRRRRWWLRGVNTSLPFLTDGFIFLGLQDPQDREGAVKKRNLKMYAFFFPRFCCFCCCFSLRHPKLLDKASACSSGSHNGLWHPHKKQKKSVGSIVGHCRGRTFVRGDVSQKVLQLRYLVKLSSDQFTWLQVNPDESESEIGVI